jgi:hypothetical protein
MSWRNAQGDKTALHYNELLADSRVEGKVGINQYMFRPTEPTSRLGYRGKKVKKSDAKIIAAKLIEAAKRDPSLIPAALNAVRKVEGFKAQERAKQHSKKNVGKTTQQQIEEARKMVKRLEEAQLKSNQSAPAAKVNAPQETRFDEYELRQKLLKEAKDKMAADLKVSQFGKDVFIKCRNNPG